MQMNPLVYEDKGSVSVSADGIKSYAQLFNDLRSLVDMSKVTTNARLVIKGTTTIVYRLFTNDGSEMTFTSTSTSNNTVTVDRIHVSTSSKWLRCQITTTPTYSDRSSTVVSGNTFTIEY